MVDSDSVRIARMYRRDCAWAIAALVALWLTIGFVFSSIWMVQQDPNIRLALAGGAAVLLLLNTASIVALVRHYTVDKIHLYGLDIFYIDAMRAVKRGVQHVR